MRSLVGWLNILGGLCLVIAIVETVGKLIFGFPQIPYLTANIAGPFDYALAYTEWSGLVAEGGHEDEDENRPAPAPPGFAPKPAPESKGGAESKVLWYRGGRADVRRGRVGNGGPF